MEQISHSSVHKKIIKEYYYVAVSVLLYDCTPGEKLDRNYTRILHAILNKSWNQHATKKAAVWPLTSHLVNCLKKDEQDMLSIVGEVRKNP